MRRDGPEATSSRACTDVLLVLLDLMYVCHTSCVLFDVVRALRRARLRFEDR